ncbi:MAG: ABC transporter permease subunit [Candidatus Viridilinea halotolerans]|uniref:ABC transporter permease subunit n=1 Tax=Candidatus Viridilinea halotolerans TaxID=2491704 RepID=A0A426TT94_9CHLR|nr:MAG: ABC transporter permease subunit [Candidatus Viridilinea halotolerans]
MHNQLHNPTPATHVRQAGFYVLRFSFYALLVGPILALVLYALSMRWFFPQLLPAEWTLTPWLRQLSDARTQAAVGTSLQTAGITTALALLLGLPAARVLGLRRFRGRTLVLLILFLPTVVPPLAIGMGLNVLFLRLGLAGSVLGVVLVHVVPVLPYTIFALLGVFARYDEGYEIQARTLGASTRQVWRHVALPLLGPGLAVAALFAFLVSWSQYILTLLIGGGQVITLPILLFAAVAGGNPTSIAGLALLFAAPPVLAIALAARALGIGATNIGQQF